MKLTSLAKAIAIGAASLLTLGAIGAASNNQGNTPPTPSSAEYAEQVEEVQAPVVDYKEVKETEAVAYETVYRDDSSLAKGITKTITEGVEGVKTKIYKVQYTDGIETGRELISEEVTRAPVNKVVAVGTYVAPPAQTQAQSQSQSQSTPSSNCQNGTYVNSAGNTVCRPSSSNTGGATAICRDGSYSYSQSRRGTCSHHGGVSTWL